MEKLFFVLSFCAVVWEIGGCTMVKFCDSTGGMEIVQTEGLAAESSVDDPCFRDWLSVESAVATRTSGGCLTAQVDIRNVHREWKDDGREDGFTAQCRFHWFDAKGLVVQPDGSNWRRLTWRGGESVSIKATAPAPEATRYVLRLRHAR